MKRIMLAFVALVVLLFAALAALGVVRADADNDAKLLKGYLKQVFSSDVKNRADAAFALGEYPSPQSVAALIKALNDREPSVRANAATALYNIGTPLAVPAETALRIALADRDGVVRANAVDALAELGVPEGELTGTLSALLRAPDGRTQVEAAKVWLRLKGDPRDAIMALGDALRDPDEHVRLAAIEVLGKMEPLPREAVGIVKRAMTDKDSNVRHFAASALSNAETKGAGDDNVTTFLAGMRDRESLVRMNSADALGKIGAVTPEVVPALLRALKDKDSDVRRAAVNSLGKIKAREAVPALRELWTTDKDTFVHSSVGEALEKMGEKAN